MQKALSFLGVAGLLVAGCASSQTLSITAGPGQETVIRDGLPALVSKKKHMVVLRPNSISIRSIDRPTFTLAVKNLGTKPETLLETSITAYQTVQGKRANVRVYRYQELVEEEQTAQAIRAMGTALAGAGRAMAASNAGYVNTTGTVNSYGRYGTTYGTYSAITYDPLRAQLAQQAANAETQADFEKLEAEGSYNLQRLQATILKDNTVMAGEWVGGTIVLERPQISGQNGVSYSIIVDFGGEQHEFLVTHMKT